MHNFIQNLQWRGMIHDMTPGIAQQLQKEKTTAYIGFEPTAPSLHIGNLAAIMLLKHFQLAGHQPIALVGGATGLIGDPAGKTMERNLLSEEAIRHNQACICKQLSQFLDFSTNNNPALLLNNIDWFKDFGFLKFLREVGKHIPLSYMVAKDIVKKRLKTGISFTEFTYQLLQGYDFYHLYITQGVKLQMGGADQWGNLTTGLDLIRRKTQAEAFALTTPLITRMDGSKFGKTEEGNIWLDPHMTPPYKFYQFWLNCSDDEAKQWIKVFTLLQQEEINELIEKHTAAPHERILQKTLAQYLTTIVHSEAAYQQANKATSLLFGQATKADLLALSEQDLLTIFASVSKIKIPASAFTTSKDVTDLLTAVTQGLIFSSKREVRAMIQAGGVSINKEKVLNPTDQLGYQLIKDKYLVVQKGKKNYYLILVES